MKNEKMKLEIGNWKLEMADSSSNQNTSHCYISVNKLITFPPLKKGDQGGFST